jgi:Uma2 family endonuclease
MVCGPIELDPTDSTRTTITHPGLIVEVLSPSTEQDDRGDKWRDYQLISSLREYVLVSQGERRVERFRRLSTGGWEYIEVTEGSPELSTGATLDLATLYAELPD